MQDDCRYLAGKRASWSESQTKKALPTVVPFGSRRRGRPGHHVPDRKGTAVRRAPCEGTGRRYLHAPRCPDTRADGCPLQDHPRQVGPAGLPCSLDRRHAQGRSPGARDRLLACGISHGHGHLMPLLHPDGKARRAPDELRRCCLLAMSCYGATAGGEELQRRQGAPSQGGPGELVRYLREPGDGTQANPGPCPLAGPSEDEGRLGDRKVRRIAGAGREEIPRSSAAS